MEHRHTTSKEAYTFLITCTLVKRILSFLPPEKKKKKNPRMDELMCRRREKREEMNEERPIGSLSCFGFKINRGHQQSSLLEVDWVRVPTLYCNIKCTPVIRRKPDLEQITDKNQQTQRKGSRQDTRFTVNFLVEFVGSIKVLKEKQTKKLRPYVYAMYALFSRRFPSANLANVGSSGFYVHPSLAGPIG